MFSKGVMMRVLVVLLVVMVICEAGKSIKGRNKDNKKDGRKKGSKKYSGKCKPQITAEYELAFQAGWTERSYPRMYPRYRPSAEWSKLIGRTHTSSYTMWDEGSLASESVRHFAENSDTQGFDNEAQGYEGIRDTFTAAPIKGGSGKSATNFIADGEHSKVSFMVRLIPSPDWFVGMASFDLCERKKWKSHLKMDLYPMDAGTDRGLTFTSPDWPSEPREPIYRLSPRKPAHSASSFYYQNMTSLPPIARVYLTKIAEYRRKGKAPPPVKQERNLIIYDNEDFLNSEEDPEVVIPKLEMLIDRAIGQSKEATQNEIDVATQNEIDVVDTDSTRDTECRVSEWSDWSACSRTCGFGRQERRRNIIQRSQTAGRYCPVLREDRTCGSMRSCEWTSFRFLNSKG